jgi:hypothetical protein
MVVRSAKMALACVVREYPVAVAHVLRSSRDLLTQRDLHPAFYGCFDWHSAVHNYWLLARVARLSPNSPIAGRISHLFDAHITAVNGRREAAYLATGVRGGFERPYGLAWLLQLCAEFREWRSADALRWLAALRPLERAAIASLRAWLPKLSHPIRAGTHAQTAFALGLSLDYARGAGDAAFTQTLLRASRRFYARDRDAPIDYEPSGHDFLSPALGEADLMRRVMAPKKFAAWLWRFAPAGLTLQPVGVADPRDGQLAHFAGLNLSRAWMLQGIADGLPPSDPRAARLRTSASRHRTVGFRSLALRGYETTHWLGTFAVYLETARWRRTRRAP